METDMIFPDKSIADAGPVSSQFMDLGIKGFQKACRYVHELPYSYNSNRDDLMILFKENRGSCTTKHAVIATLAEELNLSIVKSIGIYAMTEEIVSGTQNILENYHLPYVPMVHCFLVYQEKKVDLTQGNFNGKNQPIDTFLYTKAVAACISARDEYLLYRNILQQHILIREELEGAEMKRILKAHEAGIALLKANIEV